MGRRMRAMNAEAWDDAPGGAAWDPRLANVKAVQSFPYYSTVRLGTTRSGGGPFTYTGDTTPKKAFGYKIGDVMDAAGFPTGTIATEAETNLLEASKTRNGATVLIWGISIGIAKGEPKLIRQFFREAALFLQLSGDDNYQVGRLDFFPQVGGPYGQERSQLEAGNLAETAGPGYSYITNGNPNAGSFFKLPDPMLWSGSGSNLPDQTLILSVVPKRAITVTSTDRAAVAGAAPGASGRVEAFTSPANQAEGTYLDLVIRLHCQQWSNRSRNR